MCLTYMFATLKVDISFSSLFGVGVILYTREVCIVCEVWNEYIMIWSLIKCECCNVRNESLPCTVCNAYECVNVNVCVCISFIERIGGHMIEEEYV